LRSKAAVPSGNSPTLSAFAALCSFVWLAQLRGFAIIRRFIAIALLAASRHTTGNRHGAQE